MNTAIPFLATTLIGVTILNAQTPLKTVRVASGLKNAVGVYAPPGDRERIFIVQQEGYVRIVKNGKLLTTPFLDINAQVFGAGEGGLLGLAFHPDYATNGYFFVNLTGLTGLKQMVARYKVSSNPDIANPSSRKVVLGPITIPNKGHYGGSIKFGKDGYLYIGIGDGGGSGDPGCYAQRGNTLLGKLLRIDINTTSAYKIPSTNPFVGNAAVRDEIWALGLRQPWRFSFDSANGDLYLGDVGEDKREEINFQPGTSKGGENYGWRVMEGSTCFGTSNCPSVPACRNAAYTLPIHEYGLTTQCVIGGHVYRGCAIPDLKGTYFFADWANEKIWSFRYAGGKMTEFKDRTTELKWTGKISSFGVDACGEIYICKFGQTATGEVYKIVPAGPPPVIDLGYGKIGGNGKAPEFYACGLLTSGSSAEFHLTNAPASTLSLLMISTKSNPIGLFGGTIVTLPTRVSVVLATDKSGKVHFTAPGGGGPFSLYAQFLVLDPKASFGLGISNALRVDFQR